MFLYSNCIYKQKPTGPRESSPRNKNDAVNCQMCVITSKNSHYDAHFKNIYQQYESFKNTAKYNLIKINLFSVKRKSRLG